MSDPESFSEEIESHETAGDTGSRTGQVRAQAQMAWNRVQNVMDRESMPRFPGDSILASIDRLPSGVFPAIAGGSMVVATILQSFKRPVAADRIRVIGLMIGAAGMLIRSRNQLPSS